MSFESPIGRSSALTGVLSMLAASCGGSDGWLLSSGSPGDGAYAIHVGEDGRRIELLRGEVTLLALPEDAFELGIVSALDDGASYDPFWLEHRDALFSPEPPRDLRWVRVGAAEVVTSDERGLTIFQTYEGGIEMRVDVRLEGDSSERGARFSMVLAPTKHPPIAYVRIRARSSLVEAFYGLGEWLDDVNHRGKLRPMQLEADLSLENASNEAHVPIPFLIGDRGWGLFVESRRLGLFDVARKEPDLVEVTYGTAEASGEGLRVHLFAAPHPLDVPKLYYEATAFPLLPAPWAYGPWIWRDESRDQAEVLDDIRMIRDLDLATSAIWIDRPYATAVNTFDFDANKFPDPASMIARAHASGLRVALWSTPYLSKDAEPLLGEAKAKGYFPPKAGLLLNRWGEPIDFTNPEAFSWWQSLIRRYTGMGIEGFKLDYGEDIIPGVGGARTPWRFGDESDERTMHYGYTLLYHRAYAEMLPEGGGFLLCRAARWGDQKNVSVIWPGDLDASFARHREVFVTRSGDRVHSVGGLPASVTMGLSLGPSGFPFFGADTGGYLHSPPDEELFIRWFEQTALSTVMQVGDSSSQPPWVFTDENGRSERTLDLYRTYARLHLRLFPYVWTYAENIARDGRPIQRALGLAHPELGVHPSDTYLFGDHLLVAPVVDRGVTRREVFLPPGEWIDWWDGERYSGAGPVVVSAPLERLPLFLRAGGIVPMLRPDIDTLSPIEPPASIESYAETPGPLFVRIAPGPDASFELFDGTLLEQREEEGAIAVRFTRGSEFRSGVVFEIVTHEEPRSVVAGGRALARSESLDALWASEEGWTFSDEAGGMVHVGLGDGDHDVRVRD